MKSPFSYEETAADRLTGNRVSFRVRDADDNRIATCFEELNAKAIVQLLNAGADAQLRAAKLETALKELSGFAERNSQRAEAAWKAADKELGHPYITSGTPSEAVQAASARWHEANRFRQVVVDRVKEALAP